jgi:hypothetical protein
MQTTLIYLTSAAVATVGASYAAVPLYRSAINQHLQDCCLFLGSLDADHPDISAVGAVYADVSGM